MGTLIQDAAEVATCATAIDNAIVAKGGTLVGGGKLRNAAAGINSIETVTLEPSLVPPGGWKDDGNMHIWVSVTDSSKDYAKYIKIYRTSGASCSFNWGDGYTSTIASGSEGYVYTSHKYTSSGEYVITIQNTGTVDVLFGVSTGYNFADESQNSPRWFADFIKYIEIPSGFGQKNSSAFNYLRHLIAAKTSVVAFNGALSLKTLTNTVSSVTSGSFVGDESLERLELADQPSKVYASGCIRLKTLIIPDATLLTYDTVGTAGQEYATCRSLDTVVLGTTFLNSWMFYNCFADASKNITITFPKEITKISPDDQTGTYKRNPFPAVKKRTDVYFSMNTYDSVKDLGNGIPWGGTSYFYFHFTDGTYDYQGNKISDAS